MAFRIKPKRSLEKNLRRLVQSQASKATEALRGETELSIPEVVHDVRKRFKRIRALARLSKQVFGDEVAGDLNHRFRDASRPLSDLRDADVLAKSLDALAERWSPPERPEVFATLHDLLENRIQETRRHAIQEQDRFSSVLDTLRKAICDFERSEFERDDWDALAEGLTRMYRKCFAALEMAKDDPTDENLHNWRKRVKDLLYESKILAPVRPLYFHRLERQADELSELLGEDHDLAVLRQFLDTCQADLESVESIEVIVSALDERRHFLQGSAFSQGTSMLSESVDAFGDRVNVYLKAWRAEAKAAAFDHSLFE